MLRWRRFKIFKLQRQPHGKNAPTRFQTGKPFRSLLETIPEADTLADYCNSVEAFRKHRPAATGKLADHVRLLDELVWEEI